MDDAVLDSLSSPHFENVARETQDPGDGVFLGLPKIEYSGGATEEGVPDLRLGVALFDQWAFHRRGQASRLIPLERAIGDGFKIQIPKDPQKRAVKTFTFPDGTTIYFAVASGLVVVYSPQGDGVFVLVQAGMGLGRKGGKSVGTSSS